MWDMEERLALLHRLEEYFLAALTTKIGAFMEAEAGHVELVPLDSEQPASNHEVFRRYAAMVEEALESHLEAEGLSSADLVELCKPLYDAEGDDGGASPLCDSLSCIEYILATAEYPAFMQMVADHTACQQWEQGSALEEEGCCLEGS